MDMDCVEHRMFALVLRAGMAAHLTAQHVRATHFGQLSFILTSAIIIGECPTGPAWADKAQSQDTAHQEVECSNAGLCDRSSGICNCFSGFTGRACQRSK